MIFSLYNAEAFERYTENGNCMNNHVQVCLAMSNF